MDLQPQELIREHVQELLDNFELTDTSPTVDNENNKKKMKMIFCFQEKMK